MNEPIRKPDQANPESYRPKKPEILNMAEAAKMDFIKEDGASAKPGFPKKRNVLSPIRKCNHDLHYFPNAMSVCMEYLDAVDPDKTGENVPAISVGTWPLPAGTYDPALDSADIPGGASIFGLFDEGYNKYRAPESIPGLTAVTSLAGLKDDSYCVLNASSGFDYLIAVTENPAVLTVKMPVRTKFDYAFISGVSGAAFSATWWNMRYESADITQEWDEPVIRAFHACGYECEIIHAENREEAEELYKTSAVKSIDKGLPVLAKDAVGPPTYGVIAGYDDYGDTLICTDFFSNYDFFGHKPDSELPHLNAQKRSDWILDIPTIALFTGKLPVPDMADTYKSAFEWAITVNELERVPGKPELYCGNAALRKAAEDLLNDDNFPENDKDSLAAAHNAWDGLMSTLYGRDRCGVFVRRAKEYFPAASDELEKASACYDSIMGGTEQLAPKLNTVESGEATFDDPKVRKGHAELLLKIAELDLQAIGHIKEALTRIGAE